jgi:hypothetical protein
LNTTHNEHFIDEDKLLRRMPVGRIPQRKEDVKKILDILATKNGEIYKKDLINLGFEGFFLDWLTTNHSSMVRERHGIITTKKFGEPLILKHKKHFSY